MADKTPTANQTAARSSAPQPQQRKAPSPKIVVKGTSEFRHDLFKADVATFKKNVSYKKGVLQLVSVEHSHIYHTHSSQGRPMQFTSTIGGHFHEVTTTVDAEGNIVAKCGPPLRTIVKKKASGSKRVNEPVRWYDDDKEDYVVDNHRHEMLYMHSEYLTQEKVAALRSQTQAAVRAEISKGGAESPDAHQTTDVGDGTTIETDDD